MQVASRKFALLVQERLRRADGSRDDVEADMSGRRDIVCAGPTTFKPLGESRYSMTQTSSRASVNYRELRQMTSIRVDSYWARRSRDCQVDFKVSWQRH